MKGVLKLGAAIMIVVGLLALVAIVVPVPGTMKLGELEGPDQKLRFVVPPSRNPLYQEKEYHILCARPAGEKPFDASGRLMDSTGSEVARINISPSSVRTNWLDTKGLDGYLAAPALKLTPGATYTLELQSLDPLGQISVWIEHYNLQKPK